MAVPDSNSYNEESGKIMSLLMMRRTSMPTVKLKTILVLLFATVLSACGGGGGGGGGSSSPQNQTIAFATPGTANGMVGATVTNTASGGAGTGAIVYLSSNISVATVDPTTGVASLVSVGSTTITATKAASTGYNSATASYTLTVTAGTQSIALAQAGPLQVLKGFTVTNTASGGAGTGAITYVSSNTAAATVNSTSGVVTGTGVGSTTITATKAADANYGQAQVAYTLTVQTQAPVSAWIGPSDSQVTLPSIANGAQFIRTTDRNCDLTNFSVCASVQSSLVAGAPITDTVATVATPAYYSLKSGSASTNALPINTKRFSERIGHTALFFNNRYWVIGGSRFNSTNAKNDVWSSADGKTWELETSNAGFAPRWFHQSVVYNNKMWVICGVNTASGLSNDVWSSTDGKTWTQVAATTPLATVSSESLNVTVFNNAMWAVITGRTYSSTDGITWTPKSLAGAIDGGVPRGYASLTSYASKLWYIAGAKNYGAGSTTASTANDVWSSSDGISWTQVTGNAAFSTRWRHASFVMNNRLWVFGGIGKTNGVDGPITADAWSTTDGVTWTPENGASAIDRSLLVAAVQETNKVTLIGGSMRGYSDKAWQSTDGNQWTELSSFAQFSPRAAATVEFLGDMWTVGGFTAESNVSNEIWRNSNGLTWTRVTPVGPVFSPRDGHQAVVFNGRLWVIGGWDESLINGGTETPTNDVWSSADGIHWIQHNPVGTIFSPRAGHKAAVFNGKLWIVGGGTAINTYVNDVWSTVDGVNWVQETASAAFVPRTDHGVVAFNNLLWLFGGNNGSTLADIWKSTDGVSWTVVRPMGASFAPRLGHVVTTYNNRMWLIGGESSTNYDTATRFNDVWSTIDGITWTQNTAATQFGPRAYPGLVNHNNELWVIGGFNLNPNNEVWRSTDGVNWRVGFNQNFTAR